MKTICELQLSFILLDYTRITHDYLNYCTSQIRTLGMLRSRFEAVPLAFCDRLVPSSKGDKIKYTVVLIFIDLLIFVYCAYLSGISVDFTLHSVCWIG